MNPITPLHWLKIFMQLTGSETVIVDRLPSLNQSNENTVGSCQDSILGTSTFPRLEFLHLAKVRPISKISYI